MTFTFWGSNWRWQTLLSWLFILLSCWCWWDARSFDSSSALLYRYTERSPYLHAMNMHPSLSSKRPNPVSESHLSTHLHWASPKTVVSTCIQCADVGPHFSIENQRAPRSYNQKSSPLCYTRPNTLTSLSKTAASLRRRQGWATRWVTLSPTV